MCLLCEYSTQQRLKINDQNNSWISQTLSIAPAELIDNNSVTATRQFTSTDRVLDYYLHTPGGAVKVSGGGFGEQTIQSVAIPEEDQIFFRSMVERLDNIINLNFRETSNAKNADVDFFYDTEIDLDGTGNTLGLATTSGTGGWELFLNYPQVETNENYRRYVLIHEFGHALGLEHPFENADGDSVNGITDPWASSFPEETVMAYRNPKDGKWPEFFTDNDLNALINIWGAKPIVSQEDLSSQLIEIRGGSEVPELTRKWLGAYYDKLQLSDNKGRNLEVRASTWSDILPVNRVARAGSNGKDLEAKQLLFDITQLPASQTLEIASSVLEGSNQGETLRGLAGWDVLDGRGGDDLIHGGNGRDIISGGTGADELHGDFGWNTYTDQRDGSTDLIAIKSDQYLSNWWYGTMSNSPNGEKADIIEGIDIFDTIKILGVSSDRLSFQNASAHGVQGIGIFADKSLEALYTGGDLSAAEIASITSGDDSDAVMSNSFWSYNFGQEIPDLA